MEAGSYKARGVEAKLGFTSGGKEQVAVLLETEAGRITWYGYFTEKTTERTLESLRYLGWTGDDLFDLTGIDQNDVTIVVEEEQDQDGTVRAKVRWINSGGGLAMREVMNDADARAFAAKMKGAAVASRQKVAGAAPPAQRQERRGAPPAQRNGGGPRGQRSGWDDAPPPGDEDAPF